MELTIAIESSGIGSVEQARDFLSSEDLRRPFRGEENLAPVVVELLIDGLRDGSVRFDSVLSLELLFANLAYPGESPAVDDKERNKIRHQSSTDAPLYAAKVDQNCSILHTYY
jgi:hypothetical protein